MLLGRDQELFLHAAPTAQLHRPTLIQYTRNWTILGTLVTEIQLWSECIPLHAWLMVRPCCCLGYSRQVPHPRLKAVVEKYT